MLMLFLVWARSKVSTTTQEKQDLDILKVPFFPALEYENGEWVSNPASFETTSKRQEDFLRYDNYTFAQPGSTYEVAFDQTGPLFFLP
jgi:hypothetical protein